LAYKIKMTASARKDAQEYAAYIRDKQKSPEAARTWLVGLKVEISKLGIGPNRFAVISEAETLGFPYISVVYFSHRIIYAVHEETNAVIVHRIYHGARAELSEGDL